MADIKAQIARARVGAEVASAVGAPVDDPPLGEMIGSWILSREIEVHTADTYGAWARHFSKELRATPFSRIGQAAMDEHRAARKAAGASGDSIRRDISLVRWVAGWVQRLGGRIDPSVFLARRPRSVPTVTRRYDPEAMSRLLAMANPRDRAILEVAAMTGMRAGEMRAFSCEWIDWERGVIQLPFDTAFAPKGRRPRMIPLGRELRRVLEAWLEGRREGLVFRPIKAAGRHGANRGVSMRKVIRRAREASGVDIRDLHDLRHHYLSWLSSIGADPESIREIAGHRDARTTQRYQHAARDYLRRTRELIDRESAEEPVRLDRRRA